MKIMSTAGKGSWLMSRTWNSIWGCCCRFDSIMLSTMSPPLVLEILGKLHQIHPRKIPARGIQHAGHAISFYDCGQALSEQGGIGQRAATATQDVTPSMVVYDVLKNLFHGRFWLTILSALAIWRIHSSFLSMLRLECTCSMQAVLIWTPFQMSCRHVSMPGNQCAW